MSTIASPRDPSTPLRRNHSNLPSPATSTRPSTDSLRPPATSPQPPLTPPLPHPSSSAAVAGAGAKRNNRAALREYYNLRRTASGAGAAAPPTSAPNEDLRISDIRPSELDSEGFDAAAWVEGKIGGSGLEELLRIYTGVLGEIRALDAEKKALVYDNYSKLIAATETIRKMRANMDPLNPMASMLDPKIAQIHAQASQIRDSLRASLPAPVVVEDDAAHARQRTQELAAQVLAVPAKLRALVAEGKVEEARAAWEMPRRLLVVWREKGLGGGDVAECLEEGDAVFEGSRRGEGGSESGSGSSAGSSRES